MFLKLQVDKILQSRPSHLPCYFQMPVITDAAPSPESI